MVEGNIIKEQILALAVIIYCMYYHKKETMQEYDGLELREPWPPTPHLVSRVPIRICECVWRGLYARKATLPGYVRSRTHLPQPSTAASTNDMKNSVTVQHACPITGQDWMKRAL